MTERLFEPTDTDTRLAFQRSVLEDPAVNTLGASHFGESDAVEAAAARLIAPKTGTLRVRCLDAIREAGDEGRTAIELADQLDALPYSCAPRLTELKDAGWIVSAPFVRTNPSGARATVWRLTDRGRTEWEKRRAT